MIKICSVSDLFLLQDDPLMVCRKIVPVSFARRSAHGVQKVSWIICQDNMQMIFEKGIREMEVDAHTGTA